MQFLSKIRQARMLILGLQVDEDLLYRGIENQPSPAYSFLFLSSFLSFNNEMFVKDFPTTMQARMLMFMTTCFIVGLRTSLLLLSLLCICPFFFPSILGIMRFFVTDFCM